MRAVPLAAVLLLLALPAPARAIVGGAVSQRDWPFMAGLEWLADRDRDGTPEWGFACGATLVQPDVVLTAAHCVDDGAGRSVAPERLRVLLGSSTRSAGGERIAVTAVVEHPGFDATLSSDVALLRLARPPTAGAAVALAQPADAHLWEPGDPATVLGWGATVSGGDGVDDLREAQVPVRGDGECALFNPALAPATEVCAGHLTGGRDACQGDSGGPLLVQSGGGWRQVGVVSYGVGCAFPTQYGVYAEAGGDALRAWIERTAGALASGRPIGGAPPPSAGGAAPLTPPPAVSDRRARVRLPSRLGSARRARRRGRLTVALRTSAPLRSIVVRVRRGRRTVALGRRRSLRASRGRVWLRVGRRRLRRGSAVLVVTARDAATGRRIRTARRVRIRR